MKKFKLDNLKEIINKQMEINWYKERWDNIQEYQKNADKILEMWWNSEAWYTYFTTTKEKEKEFIIWLKKYFKSFILSKRVENEVSWFILNYWLKVIDYE